MTLVKDIDQYLEDKPEIKYYTWMNGIKMKCRQLRIPEPNAREQSYLARCWKNIDTVSEGIDALIDWRRS